jgi:hypothetical protein
LAAGRSQGSSGAEASANFNAALRERCR